MNFDEFALLASIDTTAPARLAPAWAIVPVAVLTILLIWAHVRSLSRTEMPASRRRIRSVNGLLLLMLPPLMTYALTVASPQKPTVFVFAWMAVSALLLLIVSLAVLDVINTLRLHRRALAELRAQALDLQAVLLNARLPGVKGGTLAPDAVGSAKAKS